MIKLAVISHALSQEVLHKRWRLLAQRFPVDVTLIVPKVWKSRWLVKEFVFRPRRLDDGSFHVRPLPTTTQRYWGKYFFVSRDLGFKDFQPDVIYTLQEEMLWINQQVIACRNRWAPQAKMMFFSMHALGVPQKRWDQRLRWNRVNANYDAALGHYPGCLKSLRDAGFTKPVFLQTQIGIDEAYYAPDLTQRQVARCELGIENDFVIGFAGRLTKDKGVDVLIKALSHIQTNWRLLLIGDGDYKAEMEAIAMQHGWIDRIIFTGAVHQSKVGAYLGAMDCFVMGSRTREHWVDTFPNSLVQAMSCGVPVIGSDSAAIPYLIGEAGIIVPEGDVQKTAEAINFYAKNIGERGRYASKARERAVAMFGSESLAENLYDIVQQVNSGNYKTGLGNDDQRKAWM